jgi:hypothetical protein
MGKLHKSSDKKIALVFTNTCALLFVMLSLSSCKKDPCKGEPAQIVAYEKIPVRFVDADGASVFNSVYNVDSLRLFENETAITVVRDSNDVILLDLSFNSYDQIFSNLNTTIETTVRIRFSAEQEDTLHFAVKPKMTNAECYASAYEFVKVRFNSEEIISRSNVTSITYLQEEIVIAP